jgi:hypothetical protein
MILKGLRGVIFHKTEIFRITAVGISNPTRFLYFEIRSQIFRMIITLMIKSRRMRSAVHVARMGEKRNAYRTLVGKPEGKRPLGRPRRMWVDNIKIHLREMVWNGMDWINLA